METSPWLMPKLASSSPAGLEDCEPAGVELETGGARFGLDPAEERLDEDLASFLSFSTLLKKGLRDLLAVLVGVASDDEDAEARVRLEKDREAARVEGVTVGEYSRLRLELEAGGVRFGLVPAEERLDEESTVPSFPPTAGPSSMLRSMPGGDLQDLEDLPDLS